MDNSLDNMDDSSVNVDESLDNTNSMSRENIGTPLTTSDSHNESKRLTIAIVVFILKYES